MAAVGQDGPRGLPAKSGRPMVYPKSRRSSRSYIYLYSREPRLYRVVIIFMTEKETQEVSNEYASKIAEPAA
jgi:hypothetical protein